MQLTAARFVCVQAQRILDTRLPGVGEDAFLRIQNPTCDALRQRRSIHVEHVLLTDALVPAAQQEAWLINVMAKVMVREEQVVALRGTQSRLHQLVSSRRPAVEHQLGAININYIRRTEPCRSGCRRASTEDLKGCRSAWHWILSVTALRTVKRPCTSSTGPLPTSPGSSAVRYRYSILRFRVGSSETIQTPARRRPLPK